MRFLSAITLLIVLVIACTEAQAARMTEQDHRSVLDLLQKLTDLHKSFDEMSGRQGDSLEDLLSTSVCVYRINNETEMAYLRLMQIQSHISIGIDAKEGSKVDELLKTRTPQLINFMIKDMGRNRDHIKAVAGTNMCARDKALAAKADKTVLVIDQAIQFVRSLLVRFNG
jgi:hypothetical protein